MVLLGVEMAKEGNQVNFNIDSSILMCFRWERRKWYSRHIPGHFQRQEKEKQMPYMQEEGWTHR
jgi:hypothetical protein